MPLTGHTLTVERIVDVPELAGTRIYAEAIRNTFSGPRYVIVERRDGAFICDHGSDTSLRWQAYTHIWDNARHLAEQLSGRVGEHEDLRYVGPGREGDWQAAYVRQGWYVRLSARGPWLRVTDVVRHVNLATLRRTGQVRYRRVTLTLEGGKSITRANATYLTARPACA
jgi:hypothetical protein